MFVPHSLAYVAGQSPSDKTIAVRIDEMPDKQSVPTSNEPKTFRGTVLLCGGGALPRRIREDFHVIGKGAEGSLVLIPTASPRSDEGDFSGWLDYWASFQWKKVTVVHSNNREASSDVNAIEAIRNATAIWVSGGDQNRLTERYVGTPIEAEIHRLLMRGGIVGGTSAGAAIASSKMIAGGLVDPKFNNGFCLLPNMIIDQHFSEKRRQERLAKAMALNPEFVGVGLDESTGMFIDEKVARVVGDGEVFLLQPSKLDPAVSQSDYGYRRLREGDQLNPNDEQFLKR